MKSLLAIWAALSHLWVAGQMWPFPGPGHAPTSATTPVGQVIFGGTFQTVAAGTTVYGAPVGTDNNTAMNAATTNMENIFLAGTLSDLYVKTSADAVGNFTVTLRLCPSTASGQGDCADGDGTHTLTCAAASGQTTCSDTNTADKMTIPDGGRVMVKVNNAGSVAASVRWSFKWTGMESNVSMLFSNAAVPTSNSNSCTGFPGTWSSVYGVISTTCSDAIVVGTSPSSGPALSPTSTFQVTGLYARALTTMTTGCRRITAQHNYTNIGGNDSDTGGNTFQVDLNDNATHSDTTGTPESLTAGDSVSLESNPTSSSTCGTAGATNTTPANPRITATLKLTESSQKFWTTGITTSLGTSGTSYNVIGQGAGNSTETARVGVTAGFTITDVYGFTNVAPDNGAGTQSQTLTIRDDNTTTVTNSTCAISETATTCAASPAPNYAMTAGHGIKFAIAAANTPVSSMIFVGSFAGK